LRTDGKLVAEPVLRSLRRRGHQLRQTSSFARQRE
jgi:hypothetical protein